ncbi:MAG: hypothetical protein ACOCWC_02455 [Bacteroidota bacterium]
MSQKVKNKEENFIDEVYSYAGMWGIPSKCGLKIVNKDSNDIVIVTDLYEENPGTSITEYCAQLAGIITSDKNLDPARLLLILHNPDLGSKYEFMSETFDIVHFDIVDDNFSNPKWERISREQIERLLK